MRVSKRFMLLVLVVVVMARARSRRICVGDVVGNAATSSARLEPAHDEEIDHEDEEDSSHTDGGCSRLEGEFSEAGVAEHDESVVEEVHEGLCEEDCERRAVRSRKESNTYSGDDDTGSKVLAAEEDAVEELLGHEVGRDEGEEDSDGTRDQDEAAINEHQQEQPLD